MTDSENPRAIANASLELIVARAAPAPGLLPEADTLRDEAGQVLAATWSSGPDRIMHLPGIATFVCPRGGAPVTAAPEPRVSRAAVAEAFQKRVAPLLLYWSGHEVLHASAVRCRGGVVGFCAEAGTGKSTLAYGLSTLGFPLWADDALALRVCEQPRALLLPFDPKLGPESMRFFEASVPLRPDPPAAGETAPVAALVVIKRMDAGRDDVRIKRLTGGRAFDEVVRHAYRLGLKRDRERHKALIQNYMTLVASVPVVEVSFRPGFRRFAAVLEGVADSIHAEFAGAA